MTPEINDIDTPPGSSFQNNQQSSSSIVCENCERLSFEKMLLRKKIKVLEEEKNKLEEELECSNVYPGRLKSRLFSYDNFITNEKLFRATTGLDVEKCKVLCIWILEKIVKILNIMNLLKVRKKFQIFCDPHQNQDLDQNLLALTSYFFLSWLRLKGFRIYHYMGEFYLLQVRLYG